MGRFNELFENWWLLPCGSVLISASFLGAELLHAHNAEFTAVMLMFVRLLAMAAMLGLSFEVVRRRKLDCENWKRRLSAALLLISFFLTSCFVFINHRKINACYNQYIAYLFGAPDANLPIPDHKSVWLRPHGEISHDGESVSVYGSMGCYRLIASINTHAPGKIFIKVHEIKTGIPLSLRSIAKNTSREAVFSCSTNEWFAYDCVFLITEGRIDQPYGAVFELWFKPSDGDCERMLWSGKYCITGSCRAW